MSKVSQPELKRFLEKRIVVNIQGGRKIQGTLRGYDLFLNLVVDEAVEQVQAENNQNLWKDGAHCGTVTISSQYFHGTATYMVCVLDHALDKQGPSHSKYWTAPTPRNGTMSTPSIREATPEDISTILYFIKELAAYQNALDQVEATESTLQETLFTKSYAKVVIAELEGTPVGFGLYYFTYSTWTSRPTLFLEDIFVTSKCRGKGVGKHIFKYMGNLALREKCARVDWSVLKTNQYVLYTYFSSSIGFYCNYLGARLLDEWSGCRLEGEGIEKLTKLI